MVDWYFEKTYWKVKLKPPSASQEVILLNLVRWYNSSSTFGVLHGKAGTGKTFLVQHLFRKIGKTVNPLLLAETNEAVNVLNKSTNYQYHCKTVCSALGLSLAHEGSKLVLKQRNQPDLSDYNLLLIDEASMLDKVRLELINELGIRTLYVGHSSQLPPVDTSLTSTDKCISPVFEEHYPTLRLTEAIRNTGELATFCDESENLIYKRGILSNKFTCNKKFFADYINDADSLTNFITGRAVALAWTNKTVDEYNKQVRIALYGSKAIREDFLVGDRVIFRSPVASFTFPVNPTNSMSLDAILKSTDNETYSTNTKAVVNFVSETKLMNIPVYELHVTSDHFDATKSKGIVYVAVDDNDLDALRKKMYASALYETNPTVQNKKWELYHNLSMVFSNTKHAYAITVHCSQGSTIETVFVDDKDIAKCSNPYLKKKLRYVAYSRASLNLHRVS